MARPRTPGLTYFPKDTGFWKDRKIRNLIGKFKTDGPCVYDYILCEIYDDKGYYIEYDEDLIETISADLGLSENRTRQIINYLLKRSLFDDILFKSVKVLTAKSAQRRYQSAKASNSNTTEVNAEYWLLSEEETLSSIKVTHFGNKSEIKGNKSEFNGSKSAKNSPKESKVKKSKVKHNYGEVLDKFNSICSDLPKAKMLTDKRKSCIDGLIKVFEKYELSAEEYFKRVQASDFLTGRSGDWKCSFDWLIEEENAVKVCEGTYKNKTAKSDKLKSSASYNLDEIRKKAADNTEI